VVERLDALRADSLGSAATWVLLSGPWRDLPELQVSCDQISPGKGPPSPMLDLFLFSATPRFVRRALWCRRPQFVDAQPSAIPATVYVAASTAAPEPPGHAPSTAFAMKNKLTLSDENNHSRNPVSDCTSNRPVRT
jgi:hypothetical protein